MSPAALYGWPSNRGHPSLEIRGLYEQGQTTVYDFRYRPPAHVTTNPAVTGECAIDVSTLISGDTSGTRRLDDCLQPVTPPLTGPRWVRLRVGYHEDDEWKDASTKPGSSADD